MQTNQASPVYLLAIESSCDDTGAAVMADGNILANVVASQQVHRQWGGVVPELASRAHEKNIIPTVQAALQQAGIGVEQLHAVAVTAGPGLVGSLMVGVAFAKSLAFARGIPLISTHHLMAHALSPLIGQDSLSFPYLCLLVSGGHTQLIRVNGYLQTEVLGQSQDDAAGEAFDKAAKLLGLPYPGGPLVDTLANDGNPLRFPFPRPKAPGLNYSFSGLKTAYLHFLQKHDAAFVQHHLSDICASVQHSIVDYLLLKLTLAVETTGIKNIAIAGGVAANSGLRERLTKDAARYGWQVHIPAFEYCTDNAAMIGYTAWHQYLAGDFVAQNLEAFARAG